PRVLRARSDSVWRPHHFGNRIDNSLLLVRERQWSRNGNEGRRLLLDHQLDSRLVARDCLSSRRSIRSRVYSEVLPCLPHPYREAPSTCGARVGRAGRQTRHAG
ncbi:hypothetical protein LTR55_012531, partial [Exophiala xenobiotica]